MMTFLNGYVTCTMLSTEALVNWYSHASEWMQGGASWSASSVPVIYRELQLTVLNSEYIRHIRSAVVASTLDYAEIQKWMAVNFIIFIFICTLT